MKRILRIPRRLFWFGIVILIMVIGLGIAYFVRQQQIEQNILALREKGMTAYAQGDYEEARTSLSVYLRHHTDDVDVLITYARASDRIEKQSHKSISRAMSIYRRILSLDPNIIEAQRQLLRLYQLTRYHIETIDIANTILANNPTDLDALVGKAQAYAATREFQKLLSVTDTLTLKHPSHLQGHLLALQAMFKLERQPKELVGYAAAQRAKHGDTPVFSLLQGVAYAVIYDRENATKWLTQAATHASGDIEYYQTLIRYLDALGQYNVSTSALSNAAKATDDIRIRRLYATRLWESGLTTDLTKFLANLDPNSPESDTHMLVIKALTLNQTGASDDARRIINGLKERKSDSVAVAWVPVFTELMFAKETDPRNVIRITDDALKHLPKEPHLLFLRGTAHMALGETMRAANYWRQAAAAAPAWPLPRLRLARAFALLGRGFDGMRVARDALLRSPGSIQAAVALAQAASTVDERRINQDELLKLVEQIQERIKFEEQTLPLYVKLLAKTGKRDEAKKTLTTLIAIAATPKSTDPTKAITLPSQTTFLRLAALSEELKLEMTPQLLQLTQQIHDMNPSLAFFYAVQEWRATGTSKAATELFQKHWTTSQKDKLKDTDWRLAWARLLSQVDSSNAASAWIKLADDEPENLQIQRLAISAISVQDDREFLDRVIGRLEKLTDSESTHWRVARARWLLGKDDEKSVAEAAVLLREVLKLTFDDINARRLLAICFKRMGNTAASIEQYEIAVNMQPDRSDISLELATHLQSIGDFVKARQLIDQVLNQQIISRRERQKAARLLAAQGAMDFAIRTLEKEDTDDTGNQISADSPSDILLARLYWLKNQPEKARPIFETLLKQIENPSDPKLQGNPLAIQLAADFFADQGDKEKAVAIISLLDAIEMQPGIRDLLIAEHYSKYDKDRAVKHFDKAVSAAPENVFVWRQFAAHRIRQSELPEAIQIIEAAGNALPNDANFQFVSQNTSLIEKAAKLDRLHPMVYAMLTDAENQIVAAEALRMIVSAHSNSNVTPLLNNLKRLADRNPTFLGLQNLVASTFILAGRQEDAIAVSTRAMETFPLAERPAAIAAAAFASLKRWDETIAISEKWKARKGGDPKPDILIAEAYLRSGRSELALEHLNPWLKFATTNPENQLAVLATYARALIVGGDEAEAVQFLMRFAKDNPKVRSTCRSFAIEEIGDRERAGGWLRSIDKLTSFDLAEQFEQARAMQVLAKKWADSSMQSEASLRITKMAEQESSPPGITLSAARIAENQNQLSLAMQFYRRILEQDPINEQALAGTVSVLIRQQRHAEAALIIDPQLKKSGFWRGIKLRNALLLEDRTVAFNWLMQMEAAMPANSKTETFLLAEALQALYHRDRNNQAHDKARALLEQSIEQGKPTAAILFLRGVIAEQDNHLPLAQSCYERALKLNPRMALAANNLAVILGSQPNSIAEAIRFAKLAVSEQPQRPPFIETLAQIQFNSGHREEAITNMTKVVDLAPESAKWRAELVNMLRVVGRNEEANRIANP